MTDLFNQALAPKILKATEELTDGLGPCHPIALRSGSQWAGVIEAVRLSRSASSIVKYMEHLLCRQRWEGTDKALKVLGLNLDADGCYANWQLIGRDGAAGASYYVFSTLRDLIADEQHWGLGLTEAELKAFIEPEEPSLWARVHAAIHYGQAPERDDQGKFNRSITNDGAVREDTTRAAQDRVRALGRAMERAEVKELHNQGLLPKTTAALFGQKAKDESYEQLKEECLATAHQALTTARDAMADQTMSEQNKTYKATQKAVREAMEPLKRWKPKPLGSAESDGWAQQAAALLLQSYTTDAVRVLIAEIELRMEGFDV